MKNTYLYFHSLVFVFGPKASLLYSKFLYLILSIDFNDVLEIHLDLSHASLIIVSHWNRLPCRSGCAHSTFPSIFVPFSYLHDTERIIVEWWDEWGQVRLFGFIEIETNVNTEIFSVLWLWCIFSFNRWNTYLEDAGYHTCTIRSVTFTEIIYRIDNIENAKRWFKGI
jgi:hypothetical protein